MPSLINIFMPSLINIFMPSLINITHLERILARSLRSLTIKEFKVNIKVNIKFNIKIIGSYLGDH